jgi:hypothetical protein
MEPLSPSRSRRRTGVFLPPSATRARIWRAWAQIIASDCTLTRTGVPKEVVTYYPTSGSIRIGAVYSQKITDNIVNEQIGWTANGAGAYSRVMIPGNPHSVATKILGNSGSADGRNTVYFVDRVTWTEIGADAVAWLWPRHFEVIAAAITRVATYASRLL